MTRAHRSAASARDWLPAAALVALGAAVWAISLPVPFILDDAFILQNPAVRRLWPDQSAMANTLIRGRLVPAFTLSLNYALGGLDPRGYHAFNVTVHVLAGLVLYGLVGRTLRGPGLAPRFGAHATALAWLVAALWLVHPLQTEPVIYVIQRTELLMGLFYLLTLYGAVRAWDSARPRSWWAGSVLCCALGMASKEVMVSAPLMVAVYDRFFRAPSFAAALRRRWPLYAGLAATWLLLAAILIGDQHDPTLGFGRGISAREYARAQLPIVGHYLTQAILPTGLCLDCGVSVARATRTVWPWALLLGTLAAGTAWGLWRARPVAFLGFWFFATLAPTSSVVPIVTEVMAERRMYLPLAAVVAFGVLGTYAVTWGRRAGGWMQRGSVLAAVALLALAGALTIRRAGVYRSPVAIWTDTVRKGPFDFRPRLNLGTALLEAGRVDEAIAAYREAQRLDPHSADAHYDLGVALDRQGKQDEALAEHRAALQLDPRHAKANQNVAMALLAEGKVDEAMAHLTTAAASDPGLLDAREMLGRLLLQQDRVPDAIRELSAVVAADPRRDEAHTDLGTALRKQGNLAEATAHYAEAVRLNPDSARAHYYLGGCRAQQGDPEAAVTEFSAAVRLSPDFAPAHLNLGALLAAQGRMEAAIAQYEEAVRLGPSDPVARARLGAVLEGEGRLAEAAAHYREAARLAPDAGDIRARLQAVEERLAHDEAQAPPGAAPQR